MRTRSHRLLCSAVVLLAVLLAAGPAAIAQTPGEALWTDVDDAFLKSSTERDVAPLSYRALALDSNLLGDVLATAPFESREGVKGGEAMLSLPLPEGGFGRFRIVESPIMAPELAARYPEISTYRGQGVDDPTATARFDLTPAGFHAMILSPEGSVFIDPYRRGDTEHYISYRRRDSLRRGEAFRCHVESHGPHLDTKSLIESKALSGSTLRTYRLVVAATGEYTAFHGGTVAQGQAAIVTAMNRVNGIYERDVAIRMVLVANNDQVVYTNSGSDPYNNNNGSTMLSQNQSNLDSVIGSSNYDIGHVFSTGGGGIASLRVPCVNGSKARGVTGQSSPTGDPFWVDYVAHEMGHQWGGNHTFNGNAGSCAGGNRNGSTAYEPGSGTTIQAYAGICGAQDIQNNSDDHFHGISLDEIISYSTTGNGDNCPVATATGNSPPSVNAGAAYTIPVNTPFELCGSATDPDSDPMTYGWEEFDLGSAGDPNNPSGNAPIFRSFSPQASPCRSFPQASDLVNNTQTIGEILPSYGRTMNFRLTARDNRSGGGGVADDSTTVTASSGGGPFLVTAPNTAVTWPVGASQNVTWDVAGTDLSPISCASVDITLSADGGFTYPTTLASGVPNSGSASITVPGPDTTQARVRVQCASNVFFDISNADFTIDGTSGLPPVVTITAPADGSSSEIGDSVTFTGTAIDPEDGDISASLSWSSSIDGTIGSGASFSTTALSLGSHTITASATDSNSLQGSDVITISVTPVGGGNGPQNAAYDSGLGAPACAIAGSSCDSVALLDGVASSESNSPNTLDGCTDGTSGSYHSDESNDRIVVSTTGGADFVEGATVEVDATVWAWSTFTADTLDLYYAADANSPTWVLIDSITATQAGAHTLSAQYTLPAGTLQAIRANFRYQGSQSPCSGGNYDDADDLVFAVGAASVCTVDNDCDDGDFCNGAETCNTGTGQCEGGTPPACDDGDFCNGTESCNETTDTCDAGTPPACDDGLYCNGTESCNETTDSCDAGTPVACDDGLFCNGTDSCNEATDSCDIGAPPACDDGLYCNGTESCNEGTDSCDAGTPVACDDGLYCNGTDTCNEATDSCDPGTAPDCNDGVSCTDDACNEGTDSCDNVANNALCPDDGAFCNGTEFCDPTLDCQSTGDPCSGGETCNETADICEGGGAPVLWMSFRSNTAVPGVGTVADDDIVSYDEGTGTWAKEFDGSDVGLSGLEISALGILPGGDLIMSFTAAGTVGGLSVDDSDIVRFTGTLGPNTSGTFSLYFDGSDVALTSNGEDVDSIAFTAGGDLIISTTGGFSGTGASGADEDLFIFTGTLGASTSGSFTRLFDGSDVGLGGNGAEDVDAATLTGGGELLFSTVGNFSVTGLTGADEDVVEFTGTFGNTTSGSFSMRQDLSTLGIAAGEDIGSMHIVE